jgi:putative tryptophan/tyrosine transport system substrate-binding protein
MQRRTFLTLLGGAATAWPGATRAQQSERLRRIGGLAGVGDDEGGRARFSVFVQALAQLGWIEGRNARIDYRWGGGDIDRIGKHASELVALAPDVIFATGTPAVEQLLKLTRAVPIVFALTPDPVGAGLVESLSRPGGNATGFVQFEYSLSGKWLELLKQIAPGVTRAGVLRDSTITAGIGQFAVIQSVAPSLGVEVLPISVQHAGEIERAVASFARFPNGGLIVTASALAVVHRDLIVTLAAKHRLPAIYSNREFITSGGLISYGANFFDQFRQAAGYVVRILNGEKPADLPVQVPTKYELIINAKTAKALGLTIPTTLLATAEEVIE